MRINRLSVCILFIVLILFVFSQAVLASDYETHWSAYYIHEAKSRHWLTADSTGSFAPDRDANSGEFAMMLWNALDKPEPEGICPFSDVSETDLYYSAVTALSERGIILGSNGMFFPGQTIVRERAFTLVTRAFGITSVNEDHYKGFLDAASVSDWARTSMSALLENEIIRGSEKNLCLPQEKLTRAEMAVLMLEAYDRVNDCKEIRIVKIDVSQDNHIALDSDGKVYMWGSDSYDLYKIPKKLPKIIDVAIGWNHAVALDENGKLHGWGQPDYPAQALNDDLPVFVSVSAGGNAAAALTADGKVFLFNSKYGDEQTDIPEYLPTIEKIFSGDTYTIAVSKKGEMFVLGGVNGDLQTPVKPVAFAPYAYMVATLGSDGKIYGDVTYEHQWSYFLQKPDMPEIHDIFGGSSGENRMAAIDKEGKVYLWGEYSKIGNQPLLYAPLNLPPVSQVAIGYGSITYLGIDGKVYSWFAVSKNSIPVPEEIDGFLEEWPVFPPFEWPTTKTTAHVNTQEELLEASVNGSKEIVISRNMEISHDYYMMSGTTIVIPKGIQLDIQGCSVNMEDGKIDNNGTIFMQGGYLILPEGESNVGKIQTSGGSCVIVSVHNLSMENIQRYLNPDSVYTNLRWNTNSPAQSTLLIDKDLTIPAGKTLEMVTNIIKVNKGVTLTIHGSVTTYYDPVIEGAVNGEIVVYQW